VSKKSFQRSSSKRPRVACELPDGRNARDDLGTDGLGIQLRQERSIQSTGVVQQGRDLTRGGVSGRRCQRHHLSEDPVQARRFLLEGREIEAGPRFLDPFRKVMGILVARALQRDIVKFARTDGQCRSEHPLPEGRRARQRLQRHGRDLAAAYDPDVIPVQLHGAGGPAEGISQKSEQRALL
jgi:hypothetical protein